MTLKERLILALGGRVDEPKQLVDFVTDYHNFSYRGTSKEKRDLLNIGDIYLNALECNVCGYFIRSRNRHDFVRCKCGECFIDGGSSYIRYGGNGTLRTEYYDDATND